MFINFSSCRLLIPGFSVWFSPPPPLLPPSLSPSPFLPLLALWSGYVRFFLKVERLLFWCQSPLTEFFLSSRWSGDKESQLGLSDDVADADDDDDAPSLFVLSS